jgi:hypothetical protein
MSASTTGGGGHGTLHRRGRTFTSAQLADSASAASGSTNATTASSSTPPNASARLSNRHSTILTSSQSTRDVSGRKAHLRAESATILRSLGLVPTPEEGRARRRRDSSAKLPGSESEGGGGGGGDSVVEGVTDDDDDDDGDDASRTVRPAKRTVKSSDAELSKLKSQLARKESENATLKETVARLERELKQAAGRGGAGAGAGAGGDVDLERLEAAFAQQEQLLQGYQRENERGVVALEESRKRSVFQWPDRQRSNHLYSIFKCSCSFFFSSGRDSCKHICSVCMEMIGNPS